MPGTHNVNRLPDGFKKETSYGRPRDNTIYVGIVKDNVDAQRMGRVAVWIPEIGGDPNNKNSWYIMSYASPFAGVTDPNKLVEDSKKMDESQSSYGFWMNPPDLENQVLCVFANGDTSMGYWFACIWQQNMNHMVPGIASGTPAEDGEYCDVEPPVVEYNKWSKENPDDPKRPVFSPLADGLSKQGLLKDKARGSSDSSVRREAPSKLYGWLTPRGNQVYVDDNEANEFIRLRTRSGAQLLINETTGFVYINSKDGNSWVEISDKGVDIYSRGAVSMRSEGSLNLHADGSLNIEADGNLNLRAGGNLTMQSAHHIHAAGNGELALQFGGTASLQTAGQLVLASGGNITMGASGNITQASGGNNIRSASTIYDNASPSAPAPSPLAAKVEQPRELPEVDGEAPCYEQTTRKTITRRMPTHEPYKGHPQAGADASSGDENTNQENKPDLKKSDEFASPEDAAAANSNVVPGEAAKDLENITDDDVTWLAVCLLTEAGGLGDDMLASVGQVVINRAATNFSSNARNSKWSGIKKYVLAYAAFSYFWSSNGRSLDVGSPVRKSGRVQVSDSLFQAGEKRGIDKIKSAQGSREWNHCKEIATKLLNGTYSASPAVAPIKANKRCTMYANLAHANPAWAVESKKVTTVGKSPRSHTFYLQ